MYKTRISKYKTTAENKKEYKERILKKYTTYHKKGVIINDVIYKSEVTLTFRDRIKIFFTMQIEAFKILFGMNIDNK